MSKERTPADRPRQSEGVRAFKRGLDVLREVNRSGGIRAGDVARALDLPRPTVYRLLETLEELGPDHVVDRLDIPVMAYGLRTDFQGELFPGSRELLAIADELREVRTICHCGRKATMVARLDAEGKVLREGAQIDIGGNDKYVSYCRRHWEALMHGGAPAE